MITSNRRLWVVAFCALVGAAAVLGLTLRGLADKEATTAPAQPTTEQVQAFTEQCRQEIKTCMTERTSLVLDLDRARQRMRAASPKNMPIACAKELPVPVLQVLTSEYARLNQEKIMVGTELDQAEKHGPSADVLAAVEADPILMDLKRELWRVKVQAVTAGTNEAKTFQDRIKKIEALAAERRKEVMAEKAKIQKQSLEDRRDRITAQLITVCEEIEALKSSSKDLESRMDEIEQFKAHVNHINDQVRMIDDRMLEIRLRMISNAKD